MPRNHWFASFFVCVFLSTFLHAECKGKNDHRSGKTSGLLITDFAITGTHTLSSSELARIRREMTGGCFNEDSEELGERVRNVFQNRGYFTAIVKSISIKPGDPLAVPKPVTLEADVEEGPLCKIAEIKFTSNRAFDAAKLRSAFPLKKGDVFVRDQIAGGLVALRNLYGSEGFLDFVMIVDDSISPEASVDLNLSIEEGPQYHMGKLRVLAKKELAEKLQMGWHLPEGAVFDDNYIDKYIREHRSLLPKGFARDGMQVVRNCPEATVDVRLPLDTESMLQSPPKSVACEKHDDRN